MDKTVIQKIKQVRDETGCTLHKAKKALEDSDWNTWVAVSNIEASQKMSSAQEDKDLNNGVIHTYVHHTKRLGVMVEIRVQTDFAAKTVEFIDLAEAIAMQLAFCNPSSLDELLASKSVFDNGETVSDLICKVSSNLQEPISITRYQVWNF